MKQKDKGTVGRYYTRLAREQNTTLYQLIQQATTLHCTTLQKTEEDTILYYITLILSLHCTTPYHTTPQHNTTQHNTTQNNTTQHNTTQHNTTQHNTTQHNTIFNPKHLKCSIGKYYFLRAFCPGNIPEEHFSYAQENRLLSSF